MNEHNPRHGRGETRDEARILLIEGDPLWRAVLGRLLSRSGLKVDLAATAIEGLNLLGVRPYIAVVVDCSLPDIGGARIVKLLRGSQSLHPRNRRAPILALTAPEEAVQRVIVLEFGADEVMSKPFLPREFLIRLQALVKQRTGRHDSAPVGGHPDEPSLATGMGAHL